MQPYKLSLEQARQFLLEWQGLAGPRRFSGKAGVVAYVRQAGCLQFDPVDVCGKNAEIQLFSRVTGFKKPMLGNLLYKERVLLDQWDKNMSICLTEDWHCFARGRQVFRGWQYTDESRRAVEEALEEIRALVQQKGVISSQEIAKGQKIEWPWGEADVSRAALEYLYFIGELCVHHRSGSVRYYAPAQNHLPAETLAKEDPHPDDETYYAWAVQRRIGAAGLLWNRHSDAFLAITGFKAHHRQPAFEKLLEQEKIVQCQVEGLPAPLYAPAAAVPLLEKAAEGQKAARRLEFIAPLDSLLWDRKLVKALFGFDYKWEIYTPAVKRRYGPYTLPVLYGTRFYGRIQLLARRGEGLLEVESYWPEEGCRQPKGYKERLEKQVERFARFNGCDTVVYAPGCGL